MKNFLLLSLLSILIIACNKDVDIMTINGEIKNVPDQKVYLSERLYNSEYVNVDTVNMINGKYKFIITNAYPRPARITFENLKYVAKTIVIEKGTLNIIGEKDNYYEAMTSGTFCGEKEAEYLKLIQPIREEMNFWRKKMDSLQRVSMDAAKLNVEMKKYSNPYNELINKRGRVSDSIKNKNLDNIYGISLLCSQLQVDYNDALKVLKKVPSEMMNNGYIDNLKKRINELKLVTIGSISPNISAKDPNGVEVSLSDYKGKVILIDFWASWCGPCRASFPSLKKIYNKYHNDGFDVFAISIDDNKDKWVKAIEDENLLWSQCSTLEGWKCPIMKQFSVCGVPTTILLDRDGRIIAKNLHSEELEKKIVELLKKSK